MPIVLGSQASTDRGDRRMGKWWLNPTNHVTLGTYSGRRLCDSTSKEAFYGAICSDACFTLI